MDLLKKRIEQIKTNLVVEYPYFGSVAAFQGIKQNDDIPTFSSSPEWFEYNDEYLEFLTDEELSFVLINSAMHQALGYEHRKEARANWLWIMAQDYTINSLLVNNGMNMPDGLHYDQRFDGLSTEAVYKILEDEIDEDKHTPNEVKNIKYEKMPDTNEYDQDPIKDIHQQLLNNAKMQGETPLGIELVIPKIDKNKIDWEDELYTYIENSVKFDYRLVPSNKRFLWQGIALPSLSGNIVKLVIAIDSSASIQIQQISMFLNEVESIMNSFENFEIDLLIADAKVHQHHILGVGDQIDYNIKGGGGTNFANTFEYVEENIDHINLFLYFTDGMGTFPIEEPNYEVLWILTNKDAKIPFGNKIFMIE